ncbi:hypothetical protein GYMLUDRAFT_47613 [Collybiopsis luxurians FD-317 M1]|uniref:Uncharacterized protein n=1 Tax=Collybiopsis luxurians FD-317 M1 TaxID=944289 RepID=A0A0D0C050_9AGAR|nr:hypothetical protein GYMLUDRAFT_47613 [Collybiopsis luxurians FD-317 M1]
MTSIVSLSVAANVFQMASGVCDADAHLGGSNRSFIRRLLPESNQQKVAIIFADLQTTAGILDVLRDAVKKDGTNEHKREFRRLNKTYMLNSSELNRLEDQVKAAGTGIWVTIFRPDHDGIVSRLKELHNKVIEDQVVVVRTSKQIRDELRDSGIVTLPVEDSSSLALGALAAGVGNLSTGPSAQNNGDNSTAVSDTTADAPRSSIEIHTTGSVFSGINNPSELQTSNPIVIALEMDDEFRTLHSAEVWRR